MRAIDDLIKNGTIALDKLKTDSRKVSPGDVFLAVKGPQLDGHSFLREVMTKDPALVICEYLPDGCGDALGGKALVVGDARDVLGYIAKKIYNDPSGKLRTFGVTGTNGKTTTVFLIDAILEAAAKPSGFISTVFIETKKSCRSRAEMTTPGVLEVYGLLDEMVRNGNYGAVIEISSHALSQKRVFGIELDSAVFTNITPEHMDYHGNMESYFADKSLIFKQLRKNGKAVLNIDDPMVARLNDADSTGARITFAVDNKADVRAENIRVSTSGSEFTVNMKGTGKIEIKTKLIGKHNIYNILGAVSAVLPENIPGNVLQQAIMEFDPVPGRLEGVAQDWPFSVFVDYAHTPNALENVLSCLNALADKRLLCVFGCGGDRDRTKRPVMGSIAAKYCDKVILTSDNPRTENPSDILKEIEFGVPKGTDYCIIENREEAIKSVLKMAKPGDAVIIAGKGHEDYQILGHKKLHFDDKEVVKKTLDEMKRFA